MSSFIHSFIRSFSFHFISSFIHNESLRSFIAEGGGWHRSTIKRGLCTEHARLGTQLRTCKTSHFQRLRHRTCMITQALLQALVQNVQDQALLIKVFKISLKMSTYLPTGFFLKALDENPKTVLPAVILKKKILTPNFTKFLNP